MLNELINIASTFYANDVNAYAVNLCGLLLATGIATQFAFPSRY